MYQNFYVGDTWTADRLTMNLGVRYDRQAASVNGFTQPGNSLLPSLLPDLTSQSANNVVTWNSVAPRIGMTYALGESHKTLARASYAMFASQMNATAAGFDVGHRLPRRLPVQRGRTRNGNKIADPNEIQAALAPGFANLVNQGLANFSGFDLNNPANVGTPSATVGDYKTPLTHEFQVGIDHELMPNFAVSGTYTYRRFINFTRNDLGLTGNDYTQVGTFAGSADPVGSYSVPYYAANASAIPSNRAATIYQSQARLLSDVPGLRAVGREAHVEQVDGALRVLDQQQYRALVEPGGSDQPDADPHQSRTSTAARSSVPAAAAARARSTRCCRSTSSSSWASTRRRGD